MQYTHEQSNLNERVWLPFLHQLVQRLLAVGSPEVCRHNINPIDSVFLQCLVMYFVQSEADITQDWSVMIRVPGCCHPVHTNEITVRFIGQ